LARRAARQQLNSGGLHEFANLPNPDWVAEVPVDTQSRVVMAVSLDRFLIMVDRKYDFVAGGIETKAQTAGAAEQIRGETHTLSSELRRERDELLGFRAGLGMRCEPDERTTDQLDSVPTASGRGGGLVFTGHDKAGYRHATRVIDRRRRHTAMQLLVWIRAHHCTDLTTARMA
jgi:hypothetical protein